MQRPLGLHPLRRSDQRVRADDTADEGSIDGRPDRGRQRGTESEQWRERVGEFFGERLHQTNRSLDDPSRRRGVPTIAFGRLETVRRGSQSGERFGCVELVPGIARRRSRGPLTGRPATRCGAETHGDQGGAVDRQQCPFGRCSRRTEQRPQPAGGRTGEGEERTAAAHLASGVDGIDDPPRILQACSDDEVGTPWDAMALAFHTETDVGGPEGTGVGRSEIHHDVTVALEITDLVHERRRCQPTLDPEPDGERVGPTREHHLEFGLVGCVDDLVGERHGFGLDGDEGEQGVVLPESEHLAAARPEETSPILGAAWEHRFVLIERMESPTAPTPLLERMVAVEQRVRPFRDLHGIGVRGEADDVSDGPDLRGDRARLDDQGVDPIEPPERLGIHREHVVLRQDPVELCSERFASERCRLRDAGEKQLRGSARILRRAEHRTHGAERRQPGAIGVCLDRTLRKGDRTLLEALGGMADAVTPLDQLWLASIPGGVAGLLLAQLDRPVTDVDDQAERTLPERLRRCVRRGHHDIGSRRPQPAFEEPTNSWRVVGNAHESGDLSRQTHEVQRLRSSRIAESGDVGGDTEHVEVDRHAIRRMVGPVVREPCVGDVVELLDRLERFDQVIGIDRRRVEHDDEPTDDGIDLGPLDPVEALDGGLGVGDQSSVLRAIGPPHLDVGMAIIGNMHTTFKATLGVAQQPHAGPQRGDGVEKLGE